AALGRRRPAAWPRRAALALAAAAIAALAGDAHVTRALDPPLRRLLDERFGGFRVHTIEGPRLEDPIVIEGVLEEDAARTPAGAQARIAVTQIWVGPCPEPADGGVSLTVGGALAADRMAEWRRGRRLRAPVVLRRPAVFLNHGLPNPERVLALRGVSLLGSVKSAALVTVVARGSWWEEAAAAVRAWVRDGLGRRVGAADPRAAAIATAILIGDRSGLDPTTERRLQEAGTYHVVAISGGNVAIFAALVAGLVLPLGLGRRAGAAAVVVVLAAYAVVAGGTASVARATLMASIYFGARLLDLTTAAGTALALTVLVVLALDPLAIADVGLWLTVGATAAILAGVRARSVAAGILAATVCAEIALSPIAAAVFQRITLAGLVVNFAAIPCMTVVQLGAMATLAADAAGADAAAWMAARATAGAAWGLVESARLVDAAPWLAWRVPSPAPWLIAAYYTALVGWWMARGRRWAPAGLALAGACWTWMAIGPAALDRVRGDGRLALTVFDVGQGDGLLVRFPSGRRLLVDTGARSPTGGFDVGERVIGPSLRARGVGRIDLLAITHGDPDHVGGAESLTRDFRPAEIWEGVPVPRHEPTAALRAAARRVRAGWRTVQAGDRLVIDDVEIRVLHPPPPDWERQKVRNDDSIVLELRHGQVSMLLMGDVGREVETALAASFGDLGPLRVLKVAHHGSGTSTSEAFVAALRPTVAVVSAGRGNPYGHPVPYVVDRLRRAGADVWRTDRDGEVAIVSDGASIALRSYTGRAAVFTAAALPTASATPSGRD
ncbi:MAG: DNA internalization-related competence protein ComEC/Rec2, partial [Acidobacteriota bacterium]